VVFRHEHDLNNRPEWSQKVLALLIGVVGFMLDALARGLHRRWVHG